MEKVLDQLHHEFTAQENSFLIELRTKLSWNHSKFMNLLKLMVKYCELTQKNSELNRNFTFGFWYCSQFIESWSTHENFRAKNPINNEYYELAYSNLFHVSSLYFSGKSLFMDEMGMHTELERLEDLYDHRKTLQ